MKGFFAKRYCPHCGGKFSVDHDGKIVRHYEPLDVGPRLSRQRHVCAGWKQKGLKTSPAMSGSGQP